MSIKLSKIFVLLICFFCFFSYLSSGIYAFLVVGILGVFLTLYKNLFKIKKINIYAILVGIFVLASIAWTKDITETFLFGCVILSFSLVVNCIVDKTIDYKKSILKFMYFLSIIHVAAIIVELIAPNIILKINEIILTPRSYSAVIYLFNQGKYSGIAPQTGTAAYFVLVYLIISLFVFLKRRDILSLGLNVIGFVALLSTYKRAPLLVYILILLCCAAYFLIKRNRGNNKIIIKFLIAALIIFMLIYMISAFGYLFVEGDTDEISSGRWEVYTFMLEEFCKNPIIGNGFGYVLSMQGLAGHNIYLQLLCEYGLFAILFFVWFYKNISYTYRNLKNSKDERFIINGISLCFQLFFLLYGLFGNPIYDYFELGIYMMFCALTCKGNEVIE